MTKVGHSEHGENVGLCARAAASNASSPASHATRRTAATVRCRRRCRAGTTCCCRRTSSRRRLVPRSQPLGDEIVVTKTTDSALTGTNLRLILHNLGIRNVICCGIFTDQCVSSTVRSLADESYGVIVLEDCCAAASDDLHTKELEIINMIYCHVMSSAELTAIMGSGRKCCTGVNHSLLAMKIWCSIPVELPTGRHKTTKQGVKHGEQQQDFTPQFHAAIGRLGRGLRGRRNAGAAAAPRRRARRN